MRLAANHPSQLPSLEYLCFCNCHAAVSRQATAIHEGEQCGGAFEQSHYLTNT